MRTVQLPKGCSEDWSKMQQVDKGRFCSSCKKQVHDLTNSSVMELAQIFEKNNGQLCGRIYPRQLLAYNEFATRQNSVFSFSKLRTAISSISLLIVSICAAPLKKASAAASSTYLSEHSFTNINSLVRNEIPPNDSLRVLKVQVLDKDNEVVVGAVVEILVSSGKVHRGSVTDETGLAILEVDSSVEKIRISHSEYITQDISFATEVTYLRVNLKFDVSVLDQVVATGYINTPPTPRWKKILFFPYYQTKKVYWRLRD